MHKLPQSSLSQQCIENLRIGRKWFTDWLVGGEKRLANNLVHAENALRNRQKLKSFRMGKNKLVKI